MSLLLLATAGGPPQARVPPEPASAAATPWLVDISLRCGGRDLRCQVVFGGRPEEAGWYGQDVYGSVWLADGEGMRLLGLVVAREVWPYPGYGYEWDEVYEAPGRYTAATIEWIAVGRRAAGNARALRGAVYCLVEAAGALRRSRAASQVSRRQGHVAAGGQ